MFSVDVGSKRLLVGLVYAALFLDNMLLTVVVPIIPDYLYAQQTTDRLAELGAAKGAPGSMPGTMPPGTIPPGAMPPGAKLTPGTTSLPGVVKENVSAIQPTASANYERPDADADAATEGGADAESGRVGALLASKALVQLAANPVVGVVAGRVGCQLPLLFGSLSLLAAALLFAVGERYWALLAARSLQGVASASIGVAGMSLVASLYADERSRSRAMGVVLGSVALGVLLGYPLGGMLYDFLGKEAPFLLVAALVAVNAGMQILFLDLTPNSAPRSSPSGGVWSAPLVSDVRVVITAGAILVSTTAMSTLEPCLPIWLLDHLHPQKWQLGVVFVPDSIGYLLGTNLFGVVALRFGRWRVAALAMLLVGLAAMLVPAAAAVYQLALPHFALGLGIGVVDAALVPLLARLVPVERYGAVYALQQTAVSLAYCIGPLLGGELVHSVGFPHLMRAIGIVNLLYCPLLSLVGDPSDQQQREPLVGAAAAGIVSYKTDVEADDAVDASPLYRRFLNSEDSD